MQSWERRVTKAVAEYLSVDAASIKPDAHFQTDLGIDSLEKIEMFMVIEDVIEHRIPDDEASTLVTINDVLAWIDANHPGTLIAVGMAA